MAWLTFQKLETLILLPDSESTCLGAVNWGSAQKCPRGGSRVSWGRHSGFHCHCSHLGHGQGHLSCP